MACLLPSASIQRTSIFWKREERRRTVHNIRAFDPFDRHDGVRARNILALGAYFGRTIWTQTLALYLVLWAHDTRESQVGVF